MPSAFRVSRAYSISFSAPSVSGGATTAKKPKRVGWSWTARAAHSFQSRERRRAARMSPNQTPGVEIEPMAQAMQCSSIISMACSGVQLSSRSGEAPVCL